MRRRIALSVFLMVLFASSFSWAADEYGDLWLAKSLGMWNQNTGEYVKIRVMVYRKRGEAHGYDIVFVNILERSENSWALRKSVELDTPGYKGYIRDVALKRIDDERMAIIFDIEMKAMEGLVLREVFVISPSGVARRFVEAEYIDLFIPLDCPHEWKECL